MITRIVKMVFEKKHIGAFESLFDTYKSEIRNQEGCLHLKLLQDTHDARIFFTYSQWKSENDLNHYRKSELFAKVWPVTKALFAEKPEAWSLGVKIDIT